MQRAIRITLLSTYYQLVTYLRIKEAVFYALVFPVFLFVLFGSIWGARSSGYVAFLLSGIIAMNALSQGLFAVGPIMREYYGNNVVKFMRNLPFNVLHHFTGLMLCRMAVIIGTVLLLVAAAALVFGFVPTGIDIMWYIIGSVLGLALSSFLGLLVGFFANNGETVKAVVNVLYFGMIFLSDCFYPITKWNPVLEKVSYALPSTYLLQVLRHDMHWYTFPVLFAWIAVFALAFYWVFNKSSIRR
jgi:ABC-2 type transport system permease protein